jgi:hypothetical protein
MPQLDRSQTQDGYFPLFSTTIRTTVHKICDARHGFTPFVLRILARGGGVREAENDPSKSTF